MTSSLKQIAEEVARALSYAETSDHSAIVGTAVNYPDGASVVVRIEPEGDRFYVSDDGYASLAAELMGGSRSFAKIARGVADRAGVRFDLRSFFVLEVERSRLPGAVAAIANASANAVERTVYAMERERIKRTRSIFEARLMEAFGDSAIFEVEIPGASRSWEFAAGVQGHDGFEAVYEYVSPSFNSVASANLKIGDVRNMREAPTTVVALADYDRTEPSLRQILSVAADRVIPVDSDPKSYKIAA